MKFSYEKLRYALEVQQACHKMTQNEFAEAMGLSHSTICRVLQGKGLSVDVMVKVLTFMNMRFEQFLEKD